MKINHCQSPYQYQHKPQNQICQKLNNKQIIDFMIEKGELDNKNDYIDDVFIVNLIKQEKE